MSKKAVNVKRTSRTVISHLVGAVGPSSEPLSTFTKGNRRAKPDDSETSASGAAISCEIKQLDKRPRYDANCDDDSVGSALIKIATDHLGGFGILMWICSERPREISSL
jgi:hypothetical protein